MNDITEKFPNTLVGNILGPIENALSNSSLDYCMSVQPNSTVIMFTDVELTGHLWRITISPRLHNALVVAYFKRDGEEVGTTIEVPTLEPTHENVTLIVESFHEFLAAACRTMIAVHGAS